MLPRLAEIDMVIEVRDARVPLTCINPFLEDLVDRAWGSEWRTEAFEDEARKRKGEKRIESWGAKRRRIVMYTKSDLADERYEKVCRLS